MAADPKILRDKASFALERLQSGTPVRPVFVEFSGTPKSGKSTCIDIVSHFFRRVGFNVLAPTEGASKRTHTISEEIWLPSTCGPPHTP